MKIKLNKELKNHKVGEVIEVNEITCTHNEIVYWNRRLKDAEIDNCCELVEEKGKPSSK